MTVRIFIFLFTICLSTHLKGQKITHFYTDPNCLDRVKYKTSIRRDFSIYGDSILSKVFYRDTLKQEGIYYGFKSYKEIAPFEIFHKTKGLVKLKQLKVEGRVARVDLYEKGVRVEQVKFQTGDTQILQRWVNGKMILNKGNGSTVVIEDGNKTITEYKDYKLIKGIKIRKDQEDTIYTHFDQAAIPPGGSIYGFGKNLKSTFKYPRKAKRSRTEAIVYLTFIVDKSGKISELTVVNKESVDEVFIELIENGEALLEEWQPAYFKGTPVKTTYGIRLQFVLK